MPPAPTVYETLADGSPLQMVPMIRNILGGFLFSGDDVYKPVRVLSGGERTRLAAMPSEQRDGLGQRRRASIFKFRALHALIETSFPNGAEQTGRRRAKALLERSSNDRAGNSQL